MVIMVMEVLLLTLHLSSSSFLQVMTRYRAWRNLKSWDYILIFNRREFAHLGHIDDDVAGGVEDEHEVVPAVRLSAQGCQWRSVPYWTICMRILVRYYFVILKIWRIWNEDFAKTLVSAVRNPRIGGYDLKFWR
jgi:hypothetical protein